MTPATEFYLDALAFMLALVALMFALVGVQRLAWWLADRPRRRVGEDPQEEYRDVADAEIERVVAEFRAEIAANVDRWARS